VELTTAHSLGSQHAHPFSAFGAMRARFFPEVKPLAVSFAAPGIAVAIE